MSYTRLRYHIITATRQRMPLISADIEAILYPALQRKAQDHGARIIRVGGVSDHIHLVAAVPPTIALADFVREIKTAGSRAINKSGLLDGHFNWQDGYGAFTLNPFDMRGILRYVANQKRHHADNQLWPPYERITEDD